MTTLTITYNSAKTRAAALTAYNNHGVAILKNDNTFQHLRGLCGSLVYVSLLSLPSYLLEDKKNYSIEQICYYSTHGLIAQSANEILTLLGSISTSDKFDHATLYGILTHCMLYEVCRDLKLPIRTVALFLTQAYYLLTDDKISLQKQEILRSRKEMATFADYIGIVP